MLCLGNPRISCYHARMKHDGVVAVWKPQGMTPLEMVSAYRRLYPEHQRITVSYAGRLDPMAEGVLVLLIGAKNTERRVYERLPKVYESTFVLGVATDTLDLLGVVTDVRQATVSRSDVAAAASRLTGVRQQLFPAFSSKAVRGKPLFWWARQKRLSEISVPAHQVSIEKISIRKVGRISAGELAAQARERVGKVAGDFRQEEIQEAWGQFARAYAGWEFVTVIMRVSCSGGTYIRQLVSDIGGALGCGACAVTITRLRAGTFTRSACVMGA